VRLLAVSRAPLAKIQKFKERMGWWFDWVSSFGSDFNFDYGVDFLDLAPRGRAEEGLTFTMEWLRHQDRYGTAE
jgi:predicted dithiol-disulfide oxidoreductase (DUF899 family)